MQNLKNSLLRLHSHGYVPNIVIDIGAYHGDFTRMCQEVFNPLVTRYVLIEPNAYVELTACKSMFNTEVIQTLVSDEEGEVKFYTNKTTGDSIMKEKTKYYDDSYELIKSQRLDNVVTNYENKKIFIKIDVQGAELKVLTGAVNVLKFVNVMVLEVPFFADYNEGAPNFKEYIDFMDSIDFEVFDLSDVHFQSGFCLQIDIMFVRKNSDLKRKLYSLLNNE